jgi:hypothetical protein
MAVPPPGDVSVFSPVKTRRASAGIEAGSAARGLDRSLDRRPPVGAQRARARRSASRSGPAERSTANASAGFALHIDDPKTAAALLDRLAHHGDIVETGDDGWRFKRRV